MASQELVFSNPAETALATIEQAPISQARDFFQDPEKVLDRAEKVAKALKGFLDRKSDKVEFHGKRYPMAEDWQFVAAFFGHTARVRTVTELIEEGKIIGYKAYADVVNAYDKVVSAAEAECKRDEPNWAKKPDFQLKSMAQTRACAKGLRNVFAWVMIMAGLAPTPAEEMNGDENGKPTFQPPQRKSQVAIDPFPTVDATTVAKTFGGPAQDASPFEKDTERNMVGTPYKCEHKKIVPAGVSKKTGKPYGAFCKDCGAHV